MTAEATGEKLLAEVEEENLSKLLRDIRANGIGGSSLETQRSYLGIRPLDNLIHLFCFPWLSQRRRQLQRETEHADEGHSLTSTEQVPTSGQTPSREPVIEITSPSSGDGKTSLLYYITAIGILPPSFDGVSLGGKSGAVVFLDTDFRFDARRLRDVLFYIVQEKLNDSRRGEHTVKSDTETTALGLMIDECLHHVHVFRPQSSLALLRTTQSLESYLLYSNLHRSRSRRLHALILDSASAFYWQDRREAEVSGIPGAREERPTASQDPVHSAGSRGYTNMNISQIALETVNALRQLQRTFSCIILYSTWGLQRAQPRHNPQNARIHPSQPSYISFRPHLPHPWPTFPTLRLVVRRDPVRQFAPYMSIDEARREASERQAVVARGMFSAWINQWDQETWPPEILERVSATSTFGFWVTSIGVGMCDDSPADDSVGHA